ncbi:MAG: hypothetical protein AVDCRST_MAG96-876 [uncultured Segetibacter sp.]|uniref:Uncharacterized protein n=1 Tax=uncultured Segetibacter sp. TaxID=481133 RepID=A0A6J4RQD6_9BACT|nr:MAG: hypothetical protein AVDCRST_MAG96-876 [uncultured Segetibacter sp.]
MIMARGTPHFLRHVKDESGDYLEVENTVQPNVGPPSFRKNQA